MTAASCEKHPFELAQGPCHDCGHDACPACLVFARGPKKPPICLECSITAAGVRQTSARPPKYIGKDMKVLRKRLVRELKEHLASGSSLFDVQPLAPFDESDGDSLTAPPSPEPVPQELLIPEVELPPLIDLPMDSILVDHPPTENMPQLDWSEEWSDDWDTPGAMTGGN